MTSQKFLFPNAQGQQLAGRLELPAEPTQKAALFAHCFTCGKDIKAAANVSRQLAERGFAVLRFDFTGLGNSQGDFANTHFRSNVSDLLAAAKALQEQGYQLELLIGHSLGGAAVLAAAEQLPKVKGVVTIGAPAEPQHVEHLFSEQLSNIEAGVAKVNLGGREFAIKREFLEDIRSLTLSEKIRKLGRALLVFHSPADRVVSVDNAAKIYQTAKHPKSFVSLDSADHLLSRREDAEYVAEVIASWAGRYLSVPNSQQGQNPLEAGEVEVATHRGKFTQSVRTAQHQFLADEPKNLGGNELGPTPYELLLSGLGACTAMTIQMYAEHKGWPLEKVAVQLQHSRIQSESAPQQLELFQREVRLQGALSEEQRQRILAIADKCPVHKTLMENKEIRTELRPS